MLSDSGASARPACSALYSRTICRKIGRAIIAPPSAICWSSLARDAEPEVRRAEQVRVDQRQVARALAPDAATRSRPARATAPSTRSASDRPAALLPDEDAEHDAAHAQHRQERRRPGRRAGRRCTARRVTSPMPEQHDGDDHDLEQEADPPRQEGRDEPAEQRPDRGRDGGRGADQRVDPLLRAPSKLPWISDCIAGSRSDAPRPPRIAQKMMIARRSWARTIASAPIA